MFDEIIPQLKKAKDIVFVTGAGISQESGIPTFRGKEGLWRKHDPMKLATIEAFYNDPKLVWEWYEQRRANILAAKPNDGHRAIAELEKFFQVSVLTQNIDGLHQRAGSSKVLELHGSIIRIKCTSCNYQSDIESSFENIPPMCSCGSMLRPDVVWFGEPLPQDVWNEAIADASKCDVMIIAGTSLEVSPANTLVDFAKDAFLIEINPQETIMSDEMNATIRATSADTLPKLVKSIEK